MAQTAQTMQVAETGQSPKTAQPAPVVPPPARSRSVGLDLVRVLGVIAIVGGHTWGGQDWVARWLYTWHVPVFFVMSGFLWSAERRTRTEAAKRGRTLLIPYVAWLVLVSVIWFGFRVWRGEDVDWTDSVTRLALGGWHLYSPYSAFWFVTALFFAAVIMRWAQNRSPFLPWFLGGLGVAWCTADRLSIAKIPEAAGLALPAIAFLLVGVLLKRHRDRIADPLVFGLVLLVPTFLLGGFGVFQHLNMKTGVLGDPLIGVLMASAISCGLILVAQALEQHIPAWGGRAATVVAESSIPVILGHALVLAIARRVDMEPSGRLFLLALLIPLAVGLVARKTPARRVLM
jgi:fucose 4-O-acetylase-like acetyltransferase